MRTMSDNIDRYIWSDEMMQKNVCVFFDGTTRLEEAVAIAVHRWLGN